MPGPINNRPPLQTFLQNNPDTTIEVVNVSASPEEAFSAEAAEVRASNWQEFQGQLPDVQEGDVLRVRTRGSNGNVGNWIMLQASTGDVEDVRNAQIYAEALAMEATAEGGIDIVYLGDGMISEPGATLRLTNERTGEAQDFILNEKGQLPADAAIQGEAGDNFTIAVSDGVNNIDFSEIAGTTEVEGAPRVNIPDPKVWAKKHLDGDGKPTLTTKLFTGPLFIDDPSIEDVKQGSIANCYFASAAASMAMTHPEELKELVKQNDDGTYTFTFKTRDVYGRVKERPVTIDGDLYVSSKYSTKPVYGKYNGDEQGTDKMEMWFPLLEKAYATFKGNSYDEIGNGGNAGTVMSDILGLSSSYDRLNEHSADRLWRSIQKAEENGWPVTANTYGKDAPEAERYAGERVYPWHVYSVMGVEEKDGEKFVQLRNPWGNSEPGYDGKNDGIFLLKLDRFAHLFKGVYIGKD